MKRITASVGIAGGKPCYNVIEDQLTIQGLLSRIPRALGGCEGTSWNKPTWHQCAPDLHQAILNFQRINRFRLDDDPDGHVDPQCSTIRLMNDLAAPRDLPLSPGPKLFHQEPWPLMQSALALTNVPLGISWCIAAINVLQTYKKAFETGSEDADSVVAKALNAHFHLDQIGDRSAAAERMDSILENFRRIKHTLMSPSSAFKDVTTSEAAAMFGKSDEAGWVPPPAFVFHDDKNKKWIFFTSRFQEWSATNPDGFGPNARTAMIVHEAGHYIDDSIKDNAYEWTNSSHGINQKNEACVPDSTNLQCLYYAALTPRQALNNASCYPTFAAHIVRKFDSPSSRYGAGNRAQ